MRRKERAGIDIGGSWTIPNRDEIQLWELAYVIEAPEDQVRRVLRAGGDVDSVDLKTANQLLSELATARLTDWMESSLFGLLISGMVVVDRDGWVWRIVKGQRSRRPIERRTTHPRDAAALDVEWFLREQERQGGRFHIKPKSNPSNSA